MLRTLVVATALAITASAAFAQTGARSTALYADVLGPTGAYAVGVDQALVTSSDASRQVRFRLGVPYWNEAAFLYDGESDHVLAVPVGAAALFSLGRVAGVTAAFEAGAGAVFVRRGGPQYVDPGEDLAARPYGEAALRQPSAVASSPGRALRPEARPRTSLAVR